MWSSLYYWGTRPECRLLMISICNSCTQEQYRFIHDAILESIVCGKTQVNSGELRSMIEIMKMIDPATEKTKFQAQFDVRMTLISSTKTTPCLITILLWIFITPIYYIQVLQQVTPDLEGTKTIAAQKNEDKNRLAKYLPRKMKWSCLYYVMFAYMLLTADNHRVVLKQEESAADYIHATFVNVSEYS